MPGVNGLRGLNVHTIAVQVPITDLTIDGSVPTDVMDPKAILGVWATRQPHLGRRSAAPRRASPTARWAARCRFRGWATR